MTQFDGQDRKTLLDTLRGTLLMLFFGLGALAFLIAIDRPEWFNLRPASGTAAAMAHASDNHSGEQGAKETAQPNARPGA
jgi:hypothetical protein